MHALTPRRQQEGDSQRGWSSERDRESREVARQAKEIQARKADNRRRFLDFLYFYRDFHEPGYVSPSGAYGEQGPLAVGGDESVDGMPLSPQLLKIMDDPHAWASFQVCNSAVDELYRRRWRLYSRLGPVYFWEGCNPEKPEAWASEALNGSLPDKLAKEDFDEAIDYMLMHVEHYLPKHTRVTEKGETVSIRKLKIIVPLRERRGKKVKIKVKRRKALELFHHYYQDMEKKDAVQRTSAETGYSPKEVRVIVKQDEEGRKL